MSLTDNISAIHRRIAIACQRVGRSTTSVRLIAVTKTVALPLINEAITQGITAIGENRVQEATTKFPAMLPVERHLIGHLQSNKARRAVELFDYIHSLDSISLAQRLEHLAATLSRRPQVLIQVDLSKEVTKTGADVADLPALIEFLQSCQNLHLCGLMTIPPLLDTAEAVRPYFRQLRELSQKLQAEYPQISLSELSMGMSGDFEVAIAEGATMVRVGTAIFGGRPAQLINTVK
jgi:PLP dependent protein